MWFEVLSVVVLVFVAVVVASSKIRTGVLAYGYRALQVVLVGAVLAAGLFSVYSSDTPGAVERGLATFPLTSWVATPEGWPEGSLWLLRGVVLGGISVVLLTLAQFLRDVAKLVAVNEAIQEELRDVYAEIRDNIKQIQSPGAAAGRLGDISGAIDQIKRLLKRS